MVGLPSRWHILVFTGWAKRQDLSCAYHSGKWAHLLVHLVDDLPKKQFVAVGHPADLINIGLKNGQ